jgi:hypothetical protein
MQPVDMDNQGLETKSPSELNANDRCDVCGAQAYIKVSLATGDLLFCAHHGRENKEKLEPIAISWQDETDKLLAR